MHPLEPCLFSSPDFHRAFLDMILASGGALGKVCRIDLTPETLKKARANLLRVKAHNAKSVVGSSEAVVPRQNLIPGDESTKL